MGRSGDGKRNILWGWPKVAKNSVSGVGKGNVTRNISNYADFMARLIKFVQFFMCLVVQVQGYLS